MNTSERRNKNYCIYLLLSQNPDYLGRIYIGFTVNPNRRLKQHNAGVKHGGAKKTSNKGPWEMVLVIHGFPNENLALKFEWAWQYPTHSRRLKHCVKRKKHRETNLNYHLRILETMLQIGPWMRLPLRVQWLTGSEITRIGDSSYLNSISYISETPGKCSIKCISILEKTLPQNNSLIKCFCCYTFIYSPNILTCPNLNCCKTYHIECLAKHFLVDEQEVIPLKGFCPSCFKDMLWCDIIAANDLLY